MYTYAILSEINVCHTVLECSEERTDFTDSYIAVDSYDVSYINSLWTGSEWINPPSPHHEWNGSAWKVTSPPDDGNEYVYVGDDRNEWVRRDTLGPMPGAE